MSIKLCKSCNEERDLKEGFYRETDVKCKLCINEYQRNRRKVQKQQIESTSEDFAMKLLDKVFDKRYHELQDGLADINSKLDKLMISNNDEKKLYK